MFKFSKLSDAAAEFFAGAELGGEIGSQEIEGEPVSDNLGAQTQDVHVVVLHALVGRVDVVADGGANARVFVGGNRGADTGAANHDATVGLTALNYRTQLTRDIWKINRFR
jgi:hypothetical protein